MSRYVPPALRRKNNAAATDATQTTRSISRVQTNSRFSHNEVHHYYWPDWDPFASAKRDTSGAEQLDTADHGEQQIAGAEYTATAAKDESTTVAHPAEKTQVYRGDFDKTSSINDNGGFEASQHGTLNDSAPRKDQLVYVMLFRSANPLWKPDKIIFVHTNLHLLPDIPAESRAEWQTKFDRGEKANFQDRPVLAGENTPKAISVFAQPEHAHNTRDENASNFEFVGYHKIVNVERLAPRSSQLVKMLQQKWNMGSSPVKTRWSERWEESLSMEWAVVKLADDEEANAELPKPDIQHLKAPYRENKGVNEMLQEMRLADRQKGERGEDAAQCG